MYTISASFGADDIDMDDMIVSLYCVIISDDGAIVSMCNTVIVTWCYNVLV